MAPAGALVRLSNERLHGAAPELFRLLERQLGCPVEIELTPRNRLVRMFFETYESDVLCPAVRTPRRDTIANFVRFFTGQLGVVTLKGRPIAETNVSGLLSQTDLTGLAVGSFSFGPGYDELIRTLVQQRRVTLVRDSSTALRMLEAGRADFTLLSAFAVYGEVATGSVGALDNFQVKPLGDLPKFESGAYISRHTRSEREQLRLAAALEALRTEGHISRALRRHYPETVIRQEFGEAT